MDFKVRHVHVGLIGLPGHGKDLFTQGLFRVNNEIHKSITEEQKQEGVRRPFHRVVRLSLADRLREIATWITGEEMALYSNHPHKDNSINYLGKELPVSRRDFLINLGKFIEKNISEEWVLEKTKNDMGLLLESIINECEWEVSPGEDPEEALQKALDLRLPELFVTTDLRQEHQYDWIRSKDNGFIIKIVDSSKPKEKVSKIDKLLLKKECDMTLDVTSFASILNVDGRTNVYYNSDLLKDVLQTLLTKVN